MKGWAGLGLLALGLAGLAAAASAVELAGGQALPFFAGATVVWLLVAAMLAWLRRTLGAAGPLGLATQLTALRGWLVSAVGGFVVAPARGGALAWAPAVLYTVAALCDLLDGYVARRRGEVTAVGGRLDVAIDGLGLLVAPAAAVVVGRLPWWYLAVGAAYYLFVGGLWLRNRRGQPVFLDRFRPSRYTRQFAGCQMGLTATALFPVLGPPGTTITAALFMTPNLALFARDWLVVSGRLDPDGARMGEWLERARVVLAELLPVPLRAAGAGGLVALVAAGALPPALLALAALVAMGVLTRIAAFAAAVAVARLLGALAPLAPGPGPWLALATFTALVSLLLTGAGRLALWSPEDRLMLRRAAEDGAPQGGAGHPAESAARSRGRAAI